jgi:lipopolysaccharide transport system ATP-binding protein
MIEHQLAGTVEFQHVSKRYRLGTLSTLRDTVSALLPKRDRENDWQRMIWALRGVSFCVEPGDSLGVIGPNGSGKTTTLKLLSNVTGPTSGSVSVQGRLASLIELGAGFHPELTGLENIYLNGAILGLRRREISHKLDDIIEFSGLERFMNTPVKRYSSGMYVRLGFAVAAYVEADVLLIDEVLAVGDSEFRRKCSERMEDLRKSGTTVILVSHNMQQIRRLCKRTLLLLQGKPQFLGDTDKAITIYQKLVNFAAPDDTDAPTPQVAGGPETVFLTEIVLQGRGAQPLDQLRYDEELAVCMRYQTRQPIVNPIVKVALIRSDGTTCAMAVSAYQPGLAWTFAGHGSVLARFGPVQLTAGRYFAEARIVDSTDTMLLASAQSASFYVEDPAFGHETDRGFFVPNLHWTHMPANVEPDGAPGSSS